MSWLGNNKILALILTGIIIPTLSGLIYFGVLKGKAEERLNCIDEKEKLKDENYNLKYQFMELSASTRYVHSDK